LPTNNINVLFLKIKSPPPPAPNHAALCKILRAAHLLLFSVFAIPRLQCLLRSFSEFCNTLPLFDVATFVEIGVAETHDFNGTLAS
jgi:hypothetical protein